MYMGINMYKNIYQEVLSFYIYQVFRIIGVFCYQINFLDSGDEWVINFSGNKGLCGGENFDNKNFGDE